MAEKRNDSKYYIVQYGEEANLDALLTFETKRQLKTWIKAKSVTPHKKDHLHAHGFVQDLDGITYLILKGRIVWLEMKQFPVVSV